jgi:hypothetical protein
MAGALLRRDGEAKVLESISFSSISSLLQKQFDSGTFYFPYYLMLTPLVLSGNLMASNVEAKKACRVALVSPITDDLDMRDALDAAITIFLGSPPG